MANVPETPDYPAGIYQLETSDPVLGGAGGIANRQAEQLANRTAWLKAKIDAFIDGTVAVLKATKLATARTLSISGAASGSASFDGSANANIALTLADSGAVAGTYPKVSINAKGLVTGGFALLAADIPSLDWSKISSGRPTTLGGYGITDGAPLASPAFTGNPSAPTPAHFDSDTSLATTEFVQRALGNMRGWVAINANTVLTASAIGALISYIGGSTYTVTLPAASGLALGAAISVYNNTAVDQVVAAAGADTIAFGSTSYGGNVSSSFTIPAGCTATFGCISGAAWHVMDGTATLRGTNQPTPAQFDNDSSLATTEFVQRALGNLGSARQITAATATLTGADAGSIIVLAGALAQSITMPLLSAVPDGAALMFNNPTSFDKTLIGNGTDKVSPDGQTLASVTLKKGQNFTLIKQSGVWRMKGGLAYDVDFSANLAISGYQKLPSGKIEQWGITGVVAAGADVVVTLPIAFPNACLSFGGTPNQQTTAQSNWKAKASSLTTLTFTNNGSQPDVIRWQAKGN